MESDRDPTGRTPDQGAEDEHPTEESALEPDDGHDLDVAEEPEEGDGGYAAEGELDVPPGSNTALPTKVEAWRRRSAAGAILTGFALGLQEALEKRKEEPSIVMETSGEPPQDLPVEAEFEYGRPRQSVVQIRPWLLSDGSDQPREAAAGEADEAPRPPAEEER